MCLGDAPQHFVRCVHFNPSHQSAWVNAHFGVDLPDSATFPADTYPGYAAPILVQSRSSEDDARARHASIAHAQQHPIRRTALPIHAIKHQSRQSLGYSI